jgi:uncharacterized NAD(P)/FAD-binding protein YdhS
VIDAVKRFVDLYAGPAYILIIETETSKGRHMNKAYIALMSAAAGAAFVGYITPKQIEVRTPAAQAAVVAATNPAPKAPSVEEALAAAAKLIAANTPADTREIRLVRKPVPAPRTIKIVVE